MKIIEQSHEILSYTGIDMLERASRTCYQSQDKIGCTLETNAIGSFRCLKQTGIPVFIGNPCNSTACNYHSSHKFVKMLRDKGHYAMLEFGEIIVKFITNRGVTHELVRHRPCSFAQESTRYVKYDGKMAFIKPVWGSDLLLGTWINNIAIDSYNRPNIINAELIWFQAMLQAENSYKKLLANHWPAQMAREVLPPSLKSEIIVKANFREWRHILQLRCSKKAHPQMIALMKPLLTEFKTKIPVIFDDLVFN